MHGAADGAVGCDPLVGAGNAAFERGDSLPLGGRSRFGELGRVTLDSDVVIASYATVIERPAQQLIDRAAEHLAADVPERLVYARERRTQDWTRAVKGMNVDRLPEVLNPHRILADQEVAQIVHGGDHGAGFPFESGFSPADDAGVRFDFDEHIRSIGCRVPGYSHGLDLGHFEPAGRRRKRWTRRTRRCISLLEHFGRAAIVAAHIAHRCRHGGRRFALGTRKSTGHPAENRPCKELPTVQDRLLHSLILNS